MARGGQKKALSVWTLSLTSWFSDLWSNDIVKGKWGWGWVEKKRDLSVLVTYSGIFHWGNEYTPGTIVALHLGCKDVFKWEKVWPQCWCLKNVKKRENLFKKTRSWTQLHSNQCHAWISFSPLWMATILVPHLIEQAKHRASRGHFLEVPSMLEITCIRVSGEGVRGRRGKKSQNSFNFLFWKTEEKKNVLLSAQSRLSKWAVWKAGDPTTKSSDRTVTSCGKEIRQLVGCTGYASGLIARVPFPPHCHFPSPFRPKRLPQQSRVTPGFICVSLPED